MLQLKGYCTTCGCTNTQIAILRTSHLMDALASVGSLNHRVHMHTKIQISRPTQKPKPLKACKVLVIFNILTATVSGDIRESTSPRLV